MAARVVLDVPAAGGSGGFLRGLGAAVGFVLMIAGVLVAPFAVVIAYSLIAERVGGGTPDDPPPLVSSVAWSLVAVVGVVVALRLGLRLIRGRRRLALYLRKFGHGDSTRAVTTALTSAVGRQVRVVTLDDAMVAAVGVDRTRRRLVAVAFVALAALLAWGIVWLVDFVDADGGADTGSADPLDQLFADLVLIVVVFVGLVLAASLTLFAGGVYLAALRAGRFAQRTIDTERSIAPTAARISKLSRKVFSPRLFVARVSSPIWTQAVQALAGVADVVIIDVSHPTDPLLWEVETMKPRFGDRWVLVGAYEQVGKLADPRAAVGSDRRALLARALDGEEIVAYGHTPADHARFVLALRNRLQHTLSARRATPPAHHPVAT
jgi:hypothetical protein